MNPFVRSALVALVAAVIGTAAFALTSAGPVGAVTGTLGRSSLRGPLAIRANAPEFKGAAPGSGYPLNWYALSNKTPYTMTLVEEKSNTGWLNPPDPIIGPQGGTAFQVRSYLGGVQITLQYDFTDINGARHAVLFQVESNGNPHVQPMDYDSAGSTHESTAYFHVISDPDGDPHDFDAVLNQPAEVTIDATKDPDKASSAMAGFATATTKSFTVSAGPSYDDSGWSRASAVVENASSEPASLQLTYGDTHEESTSIATELTWSQEVAILDVVNSELPASITGGHAWSVTDQSSQVSTMTIPQGKEGWFEANVSEATLTGNFTFATPQGITYHVLNATVTEPGQAPAGEPPLTGRPAFGPISPAPLGPSR